ncbi:MAG: hypothetical protein HY746_04250, partial [Elusimicrobia bacterium]|nr:hypothetical protein [Elusimicrobiota bacterium]
MDWANVNKVYISSWNYTSVPAWDSGKKYGIRTQAFDDTIPDPANKEDVTGKTNLEFVYDTEVPDTLLAAPGAANPNYGPARPLGTVSGTTTEYPLALAPKYDAGIDKVELRISTAGASNNYWNGTTWVSEKETWNVASASAPFVFTSTPAWQNGKEYTVESRGKDKALPSTNLELSYSTVTFKWDDGLPTSKLISPATWWWQKSIATISGTAADSWSLIENVQLKISSDVSGSWNTVTDWTIAKGSSPWEVSSIAWSNGVKYKVDAKAKDRSQNVESPIQEQQFVYDVSVPTVVVTAPPNGSFNASALVSISGTALDYPVTPSTGCLSNVQIRVKHAGLDRYWDGSDYTIAYATLAWYNALNDSGDWKVWKSTKPTFSNNTTYWVEAIAYDKSGNTPVYVSTRIFQNDTNAPSSRLVMPANLKAYRQLPTISGTAADGENSVTTVKLCLKRLTVPSTWYKGGTTKDFTESVENQLGTVLALPKWSFDEIDVAKFNSGTSYWAYSSAWDEAGNKEILGSGASSYFVWDITVPSSTVTNPAVVAGNVNNLTTVSGTCKDISPLTPAGALTSDGLSKVEVQVSSMGAAWSVITPWTDTGVSLYVDSYTYITDSVHRLSGKKYLVKTRATDKSLDTVGNYGNLEDGDGKTGYTIIYDTHMPLTTISVPVHQDYYGPNKTLPTISGSAWDYPTAAGSVYNTKVSTVYLRIYDYQDDRYWDGDSWEIAATWLKTNWVTDGSSWSYTSPAWIDGHEYRVNSRALDWAGNTDIAYSTNTFKYDIQKPSSTILFPNSAYEKPFTTISGTAEDPGGGNKSDVNRTEIRLKRDSPTGYWNGSSFQTDPIWVVCIDSKTWSYKSGPNFNNYNGELFELRSKSTDKATNQEAEDRNIWNFTIDNSSPSVLNVQPSTWTKVVSDLPTISGRINREDDGKYWNNVNSAFETYTNKEDAWFTPTLTPDCTVWTKPFSAWTDGSTYYIESKSIDKVGYYSVGYSSSYFKYDVSAPVSKVTLPVTNRFANTFTSISGTASDSSGIKEVKLSIKRLTASASYFNGTDFISATEVWLLVTQNPTYNNWKYTDLTASKLLNGTSYFIKSRAIDNSVPELTEVQPVDLSCYFTYDTTAPVSAVLYPDAKAYSALTTISGTCNDIVPPAPDIAYSNAISSVQVQVSTWTGSAWSVIVDWANVNKVYISSW